MRKDAALPRPESLPGPAIRSRVAARGPDRYRLGHAAQVRCAQPRGCQVWGYPLMMRLCRMAVLVVLFAFPGGAGGIGRADEPAIDPNPKAKATWPGMTRAGSVLLPNGWSLRPAGQQSPLGDFPVLLALHPSAPILAVLHAGYGEHEVVTVDAG